MCLEVSAQQRVDWDQRRSFLHQSELVIQLPGVPISTSSFLELCRYTDNEWANFQYIGQRWTSRIRLKKPVVLEVVGTIVNREPWPRGDGNGEHVVIGIVARNPFYRRKALPAELSKADAPAFVQLTESELIICSLKDWYAVGDVVDRHVLQGFEVTVGGVAGVIRPFGTWKKMLKQARRGR